MKEFFLPGSFFIDLEEWYVDAFKRMYFRMIS